MKKQNLVKYLLIGIAVAFLVIMLILPLIFVVTSSLSNGVKAYFSAITDKYTLEALKLTLLTTILTIIVNLFFGIMSTWLIFNYKFRGKSILLSLIDIPFAISPVVVGLFYVLTFGRIGWLFPLVDFLGIQIVFAVPAIVLVTIFVTLPFITREVLPVLETRGNEEEQVAAMFGASSFRIFRKITLPHIKWPLAYGLVLTTARALGEYGAVSVVSGNLRGKTVTVPLQVEMLYNEYQFSSSYAVASLLVIIAVIILIIRNIIESSAQHD
ncbi:sulfate ABC transporter permease subunit CysW [Lactococcus insecticola]|uniref:Sulfate ABC transporter permease subunit CysW n=1 Tax=Pseudolactococcus insecticola TaxID=2709158 RepID=A0A6A0B5V5_9LACT|nr:sulfate ABC transporter permease subunit CysW [Lactococcus insecticola]GFH39921.1 sulfate ABC transporter permease subunit CysW [Lactococcus insecticola]